MFVKTYIWTLIIALIFSIPAVEVSAAKKVVKVKVKKSQILEKGLEQLKKNLKEAIEKAAKAKKAAEEAAKIAAEEKKEAEKKKTEAEKKEAEEAAKAAEEAKKKAEEAEKRVKEEQKKVKEMEKKVQKERIKEPAFLTGTVTDSTGKPMDGVQILFTHEQTQLTRNTNGGGHYQFEEVSKGQVNLQTIAQNYAGQTKTLTIVPGTNVADFVLAKEAVTVRGKVTEGSNKPMQGAKLILTYGSEIRQEQTNSGGDYQFENVLNGNVTLQIDKKKYATQIKTVSATQDINTVDFLLAREEVLVKGKVTDVSGQPLHSAKVILSYGNQTMDRDTTGSGEYTFDDVPNGTVNLQVNINQYVMQTRSVSAIQDVNIADFVLNKEHVVVKGKVTDSSAQPLHNIPVLLGFGTQAMTGETSGAGEYEFGNVPSGQVTLQIMDAQGYQPQTKIVSATQDINTFDFVLAEVEEKKPKTLIEGKVSVDTGSERVPVPNATVSYEQVGGNRLAGTVNSDSQGRYTIENLSLGKYHLSVSESSVGPSERYDVNLRPEKKKVTQDILIPDTEEEVEIEVED